MAPLGGKKRRGSPRGSILFACGSANLLLDWIRKQRNCCINTKYVAFFFSDIFNSFFFLSSNIELVIYIDSFFINILFI